MRRKSTIVAITSGKGGVGKSVVATNLAERLLADGHSVALLDVDFGQGACAVLLNETPAASVLDLATHRSSAEEVLHRCVSGLTLIQGANEPGAADGHGPALFRTLDRLLDRLRRTHEYVLIDTPAGLGQAVCWAIDRADLGMLVLVGEPTAVADTYRLCKLVWEADPAYPLGTVVNFEDTEHEARSVAERFGVLTEKFTGQTPFYLGWLPYSADVKEAVRAQKPFALGDGEAAHALQALGHVLVAGRRPALVPISL